jgi:hypothetical protein
LNKIVYNNHNDLDFKMFDILFKTMCMSSHLRMQMDRVFLLAEHGKDSIIQTKYVEYVLCSER